MFMGHRRKRFGSRRRSSAVNDGVEWVCCRFCRDHRRMINNQDFLKHDTDRESYMEKYDVSPDQFIAKAFRMI